MPIKIIMPALSPTMEEGSLSKWLKAEGESVEAGEPIAEIETDKATMEIEAYQDGVLGKIIVAEGSEAVPVNTVIALMLEEGEDASALEGIELAPVPAPAETPALPEAPPPEATPPPPDVYPPEAPPAPLPTGAAPPAGEHPAPPLAGGARVAASPLARRMAAQGGLDLAQIKGTGPHGRIVKADIEAALALGAPGVAPPLAAPPGPTPMPGPSIPGPSIPGPVPGAAFTDLPHSNMRRTIAKLLVEAKQSVPHFYLTIDCEIDRLLELRKELNARSDDYKLSVNDFVVRAAALALKKVPEANAVWNENAVRRHHRVDISVAVAIEGGLVTPIVRDADRKRLPEISNELKELVSRARARPMGLRPEEYRGGTFSVSNLGMYGIREFSAIINPPQSGILALGAGEKRPVVRDGVLAVATVMTCTLSCDHRVVDGALGSTLLGAFKGLIEDPLAMLL